MGKPTDLKLGRRCGSTFDLAASGSYNEFDKNFYSCGWMDWGGREVIRKLPGTVF